MSDSEGRAFDAGHFAFLELVRVMSTTAGAAFAKGALIKTGIAASRSAGRAEYESLAELVEAAARGETPLAEFEGPAEHHGEGLFGLAACPFAPSIATYVRMVESLPREYGSITLEMNKPAPVTERLRIGHGAAVSPFCAVHQAARSSLARHITVGERQVAIYQLGCRSASGVKGLAGRWIEETGASAERVREILEEAMCCYAVRIPEEG